MTEKGRDPHVQTKSLAKSILKRNGCVHEFDWLIEEVFHGLNQCIPQFVKCYSYNITELRNPL